MGGRRVFDAEEDVRSQERLFKCMYLRREK